MDKKPENQYYQVPLFQAFLPASFPLIKKVAIIEYKYLLRLKLLLGDRQDLNLGFFDLYYSKLLGSEVIVRAITKLCNWVYLRCSPIR